MFADIDTKNTNTSTFQKISFLDLQAGQHTIRLLENKSTKIYTHFLAGRTTVACLGEACPICANNKRLLVENPDNFRDIKGWSPRTERFYVNVLDKTSVKTCPSCQKEIKMFNGQFPPTCACGAFIHTVAEHPSNKVKVWNFGNTVGDQLNAFAKSILDANKEPVPLTNYDLNLIVTGAGKEKKTNLIPMVHLNEKVEVPADAFYDLSKAVIHLEAEELLQLQRGVSLKDIFTARKATKVEEKVESVSSDEKKLSEMTQAEILAKVSQLFNK